MRTLARWGGLGLLVPASLLGLPSAAWAADGQIDQVTAEDGRVQVLFSLRDLPAGASADLDSVEASINGAVQPAAAELASESGTVERVTMLTIDVSDSMAGERFAQAKAAALAFTEQAPADVQIGLVTFASSADVVEQPTTDRDAVRAAIESLTLSRQTELYAGVRTAVAALPEDSQASVLVLSDGRDTSGDKVDTTLAALRESGARADVVALEQTGAPLAILGSIARAGGGEVISADDPDALTAVFEEQADVLAAQLLVSFDLPSGWDGGGATVGVSLAADGQTYSDEAFVSVPATSPDPSDAVDPTEPIAVDEAALTVSRTLMLGGLGALALGGALIIVLMSGAFNAPAKATLSDRIAPYGASGRAVRNHTAPDRTSGAGVVQQAVDTTEKLIKSGGLDVKLEKKLEAGGLKLHAAEWMLIHFGIAFGGAFLGYVLSGRLLLVVLVFGAGLVLPWMWLSRKESKRIKSFGSQLADTLQLISGSLSAGLSLSQSLDTVVREGNDPMAGEFRRALVEQRLGVEVEEALDGIAQRMQSEDFAWVVMAIRIQRDVGGNLAELLLTVAGTLREREYLRRQVRTLSAEGRLSAWILGGLPPVFFVYLLLVRPRYLEPMVGNAIGWAMLGGATVMMAMGALMLKKMVKVEV